jgi:regulator of vacuolar morphogenesis
MAPSLEIAIPSTTVSASSPPYTLYTVTLRQPLRSWTVSKRYSDFTTLHASLSSQCNNTSPPGSLPQKSWFKKTISSPELTESRRKGLEAYLKKINETSDARWRNCAAWRQFLNLPNANSESAAGKIAAAALRSADLQAPVTDATIWLDVHRDMKAQLRDARVNLTRRDQASSALEQHEASGDAKRCLVRAGTMITSLEGGLKQLQEGADAGLGQGELRRRKDLVTAGKKERDALETVLSTFTPRNTATKHESAAATAADKETLFKSGSGTSVVSVAPHSGRRVLGAKETDRTRELDNAGVLQLQQQIMQEQDSDVVDLTKVVTRMKEMGIQINDELQLQNEMLGMLDQDVDRLDDKLRIAKKRVDKIK